MNHSLGLMIETLVAILLLLTIGYCMLLNKRLKRLKADEHSLKAVIAELITATEIAERAIGGLEDAGRGGNEKLRDHRPPPNPLARKPRRQPCEGRRGGAAAWQDRDRRAAAGRSRDRAGPRHRPRSDQGGTIAGFPVTRAGQVLEREGGCRRGAGFF